MPFLINKFETEQGRVDAERIDRDQRAGGRIGLDRSGLLRPELIFERELDVGVDQELHARREAVARGTQRREEGRVRCENARPLMRSARGVARRPSARSP